MRPLLRAFLSIDPRTLALTRVLLALTLLLDLGRRAGVIAVFYTNGGLLPNHRLLWKPPSDWTVSYLLALFTREQVGVAFAITALIYLCFLVGYRTRLMHVLSWFCLVALQARVTMLSGGGDYVLGELVLWTAFLPLGRCCSIDALMLRLRAQRDLGDAALGALVKAPRPVEPVVSLAVFAALMQLAVIYFFNAVQKTGVTWQDGSAIHYLLHQSRIATNFALWLAAHAPTTLLAAMSYATLVIEAAAPFLIFSPWGRPWTRRIAIVLLLGLHVAIALVSNLALFSPAMIVFVSLLVSAEDWEWLARRQRLCELRERVHLLFARVIVRIGVERAPAEADASALDATSLRARIRRLRVPVREFAVMLLIVVATSQVLVENEAITRVVRVPQPQVLRAAVGYLRLNQGWSMFAPDAPRRDMFLVVDALTVDGRRIDPYNAVASETADPTLRTVPARLGQSSFFGRYTLRMPPARIHHEPFVQWIMKHHRRTGRPQDRITSFTAYVIEHDSPPPGRHEPKNTSVRVLMRHDPKAPKAPTSSAQP